MKMKNKLISCEIHKEYKKGCKDCFNKNRNKSFDDWHDLWERNNFGDN